MSLLKNLCLITKKEKNYDKKKEAIVDVASFLFGLLF